MCLGANDVVVKTGADSSDVSESPHNDNQTNGRFDYSGFLAITHPHAHTCTHTQPFYTGEPSVPVQEFNPIACTPTQPIDLLAGRELNPGCRSHGWPVCTTVSGITH